MKQKLNVLISVSDKTNLDKIAHYLSDENCNLISTGGTFQYLEKLNLKFKNIESLIRMQNIFLLRYIAFREGWDYIELCKNYLN